MRRIGKDGKDGGVVGEGDCGDGGGFVVVRSALLGLSVALTLTLSRGAGEGGSATWVLLLGV